MKRAASLIILASLCLNGCATYYKVTDPSTGKTYYATDVKQRGNGSTTLTDARTNKQVTIQNSEVQQIKEQEFNVGKYASEAPSSESAK